MAETDPATPDALRQLRMAASGDEAGLAHHSDRSLARFLRAKKDIPRASKLLLAYDRYVESEGFQNLAYSDIEEAHKKQILLVDPSMQTKDGATIIWVRPGKNDNSIDVKGLERMFFFSLNWLTLTHEKVQLDGVAVLGDWTDFQMSQFNPAIPQTILKVLQEIMPVRLKAIYGVNQPFFFSVILTVVSVFMSAKLRERLKLIGDPKNLDPFIEKSSIPISLKGSFPGTEKNSDAHWSKCRQLLLAGPDHEANPL